MLQIDNYSNWIWPNRNRYFLHNPGNLYAIIKCLTLIKSSLSQLSKDIWYVWISLFRNEKSQVKYTNQHSHAADVLQIDNYSNWIWPNRNRYFLHNPGNLYAIIKCLTLIKSSLSQLSKDIWYVWICCLEIKNHRSNTPTSIHTLLMCCKLTIIQTGYGQIATDIFFIILEIFMLSLNA